MPTAPTSNSFDWRTHMLSKGSVSAATVRSHGGWNSSPIPTQIVLRQRRGPDGNPLHCDESS